MSGSGRKRSSKWDFKEDSQHPRGDARGNDYPGKSATYFRDKEPELGQPYPGGNGRNGSRRSAMDGEEQLKSKHETRQHSGEPWPGVSRNSDGIIGNYDTRKSSALDDRQQNVRQSPEKDRKRIHRSRSRSMSRSRSRSRSQSRSPFHGVRRDSGFHDRRKNRPRVSPQPGKDFDGRYRRGGEHRFVHDGDQGDEHGWEAKNRKARDSKCYPPDDSREQPVRVGGSADFSTDFQEDNSRRETSGKHLHDGASDGVIRRQRNESIRERETHRRDGDAVLVNNCQGELHRNSNIPCKFFAVGYCRNGKYCRFSHHGAARGSPDRKPHDDRFRQDNNRSETEKLCHSRKWNDMEKSDTGKCSEVETARVNTGTSEPQVNGNWLDDMEMSPDWNYGVQTLNNSTKTENGHVAQSSQSLGMQDSSVPVHEHGDVKDGWRHGSGGISQSLVTENCYLQQDRNHRGTHIYSHNDNIVVEKPVSSNHGPSNPVDITPVQAFNQNSQNHGSLPYQSSVAVGGSLGLTATDLSGGLSLSNSENGKVFQDNHSIGKPVFGDLEPSKVNCANFTTQNTVTREQLNQISNISASLAQLFGNRQQLPQLYSNLNAQNAKQAPLHTNSEGYAKPESLVVIQPNQAAAPQADDDPTCDGIQPKGHEIGAGSEGVLAVAATLMNTTDVQQGRVPDNSVSSALLGTNLESGPANRSHKPSGNPMASVENSDKKAEESNKEQDEKKTTEENEDVENAEGDERGDEIKKGKDPKGMRAFKFALVEIVKELLKPTWKEGRMSRDAYKNIVKKVVDKVTGTMQSEKIPQTQEKIDHYLSASKPKLTKLVQAYVNKFQKS